MAKFAEGQIGTEAAGSIPPVAHGALGVIGFGASGHISKRGVGIPGLTLLRPQRRDATRKKESTYPNL